MMRNTNFSLSSSSQSQVTMNFFEKLNRMLGFKIIILFLTGSSQMTGVLAQQYQNQQQQRQQQVLTSMWDLDVIEENAVNITRMGNVDMVRFKNETQEYAICHLHSLIPLTNYIYSQNCTSSGPCRSDLANRKKQVLGSHFTDVSALALATQHFNSGNGSIISEIEGINNTCRVRLTYDISDTGGEARKAVDDTIRHVYGELKKNKIDTCGFVGPYFSKNTVPTSLIASLNKVPMFSPMATSSLLDNQGRNNHFGRLIPSDDVTAEALVHFLVKIEGTRHIVVIHVNDSYGNRYLSGIRKAAARLETSDNPITISAHGIPTDFTDQTRNEEKEILRNIIRPVAEIKYHYIIGIFYEEQLELIMEEAVNQSFAGNGQHRWLLGDTLMGGSFLYNTYKYGGLMHRAMTGAGIISFSSKYTPHYSKYIAAKHELDNSVDFKSHLPTNYTDGWEFPIDQFVLQEQEPTMVSPVLYDTVIAYGVAACKALGDDGSGDGFTGTELFTRMMETNFDGVSGTVKIDPLTGSRVDATSSFTIANIIPSRYFNESRTRRLQDNDTITFKSQVTHVYYNSTWNRTEHAYVYNDGTTNIPLSLPPLKVDENFLKVSWQVICLVMAILIMISSIALCIWVQVNKNKRVVKASQPIFLNCLLAGTLLMGASIVPLTIDDHLTFSGGRGVASSDDRGCVMACILFPWLFVIGISLAFTALLSKTRRINKILNQTHFKRITVTPFDVMKIMMLFLSVNVLILSLWTALTEIGWDRTEKGNDTYGRVKERTGQCSYNGAVPYIIALVVVNLGTLLFATYEAYNARDIHTDFQETQYIIRALVLMILVCFIGLPIVIISEENVTLMFVKTGIIFVVCMSLMGLILGPKVYLHYKEKRKNGSAGTRSNVHVSGIGDDSTFKHCKTHYEASIQMLKHEVTELRVLLEVRTSEVNDYKIQSMRLPPPLFMDQSSDEFKNQSVPFSLPSSMDKSSGIESSDYTRPIESGSGNNTSTSSSGFRSSNDTMPAPMMSEEELVLEMDGNENV